MEAQLVISGFGLSIKPVNMGINAISGAYLNFRHNSNSGIIFTIGVVDALSIGGKSGSLIYGQIETDFFPVLANRHPWAKNIITLKKLIGQQLEITVGGLLLVSGTVSINISQVDKDFNNNTIMSKGSVPAKGGQIATTMVKGIAKNIPRLTTNNNPKKRKN